MKKKKRYIRHEKNLWTEFRFEIFIGFIFFLGVFLLVEDMEIKETIFHWIALTLRVTADGIYGFARSIRDLIMEVETSDIVGIILIVAAFILVTLRFRRKIIRRYSGFYSCPDCEADLRHIHRTVSQKIIEILMLVKIRNYQCKQCSYKGIQITER